MQTSAHDVTATVDCRRPHCERESTGALRGPYAGLCDECTEAAKQLRSVNAKARGVLPHEFPATARPAPAPPTPDQPTGKPLSQVAADLIKPARALEPAIGKRRVASAEAKRCLADFNDALNAVRATAEALLR